MLFGGILWRVPAQCPSCFFIFWVWEYLRVQGSLWAGQCYFLRTLKTVAVLKSDHHWLYTRSKQFQGWPFSASMGWITLYYLVHLQHKMTATKAVACCDRLCAYCHETCTRRQLSENKKKDAGMILATPCRSVVLSFHIAENPRQHTHPQGEMPNYAVYSDPTKVSIVNHCEFESLYDFLKLTVPNSQDIANLLPDLSFIQSWKPFSGCLCCWRQCSRELNIARHCRGAYMGRWSVGYYAIKESFIFGL